MKFELSKEQTSKFQSWMVGQISKRRGVDATGFRFTFSFTPTSIGILIKVKDILTDEEIDLSDEF